MTGASGGEAHGAECGPAKLTGRIVRPEDPGYTDARLGWDQLFSHYPLVIVFAQNTQDVVNLEVHRNQILLFAVLAEGTPAEAKKLLAPILSIDSPKVSTEVGNWGDVYSGFQIPIEDEPAN
ncbi:hypothetical protein [Streptomyces sp. NBC_00316]|uniref:hypothetical protein n=1 Tax=Streptomyces sp. NBC_00316 TaxID=2975710 RepID=UPI002E2C3AE9|nr:hypothetical protein [Streptomyces sp. NBC_00316]